MSDHTVLMRDATRRAAYAAGWSAGRSHIDKSDWQRRALAIGERYATKGKSFAELEGDPAPRERAILEIFLAGFRAGLEVETSPIRVLYNALMELNTLATQRVIAQAIYIQDQETTI